MCLFGSWQASTLPVTVRAVDAMDFFAGVTDHLAESEPHAISIARNILGNLNMAAAGDASSSSSSSSSSAQMMGALHGLQQQGNSIGSPGNGSWEEPLYPAEELRGINLEPDLLMLVCQLD